MAGRIRGIVIGIAEPGQDDPHLVPAIALAESLNATLDVVHAYQLPEPGLHPYLEMGVVSPEAIQGLHDRVQAQLEEQVRRIPGGQRARCRSVPLPAALAMLNTAKEVNADLIVVGQTRHGRVARAVIGTTAQRVLRGAGVPVLVSHTPGRPARRVLLTTDLSDLSARVHARGVDVAAQLSGGTSQELRSVMVIAYDIPLLAPAELTDTAAAEAHLSEFLKNAPPAATDVTGVVRVGDPAREICAEAVGWGADLLVLGTHGRTGASRLLIGSVAESVLQKVDCDVLVIPSAAV